MNLRTLIFERRRSPQEISWSSVIFHQRLHYLLAASSLTYSVSHFKQKLSQVRFILSSDTGDECDFAAWFFRHDICFMCRAFLLHQR
mmetsp:Transcript_24221/g.35889  ORF Transcript_24221/g.35889 Transcript_24221/m.35889 type:complete len:87 (-) Transcript_24221:140-400(-)